MEPSQTIYTWRRQVGIDAGLQAGVLRSLSRYLPIRPGASSGPALDELPSSTLSGSLEQVLESVVRDYPLSLQLGVHLLSTSERTLRRRLAAEGTSWREMVDRVRAKVALDLVNDASISLANIAEELGYSQYPHFLRAFRRWTGESPQQYRRAERGRDA